MLNMFMLVGRIAALEKDYILLENTKDEAPIKVFLKDEVMSNLVNSCKEGTVVGIRGKVTSDGIYGEKVSYLAN